jgi:hypothetical protein
MLLFIYRSKQKEIEGKEMAAINFYYRQYVEAFKRINEDERGLFVIVPSESDSIHYTVRCVEHHDHVEVESCNCQGFRRWFHCKHQEIIQEYWNRMYKTNIQKTVQKAIEASMDEVEAKEEAYEIVAPVIKIKKVRKVAAPRVRMVGGKLVLVKASAPIAKVIEQAVEAKVPVKKNVMTAQFGTQGFSLMR